MSLHALVSPGGSPGATTAALALALAWPGPVILAECDLAGGDVLSGWFGGQVPAGPGLLDVAVEAGRGQDAAEEALRGQLTGLTDDGSRAVLTGLTDPRQAAGIARAWPLVTAALAAQPADVIADCGRLGTEAPVPLLAAADTVTMVLRPTLRQVARARPRLELLAGLPAPERVRLLITGTGPYGAREVAKALGRPVLGELPQDAKTARALSDGGAGRGLAGRPLSRAAQVIARALRQHAITTEPDDLARGPMGARR